LASGSYGSATACLTSTITTASDHAGRRTDKQSHHAL
jgi:hypothetical protein